jgi:hypothetical protein
VSASRRSRGDDGAAIISKPGRVTSAVRSVKNGRRSGMTGIVNDDGRANKVQRERAEVAAVASDLAKSGRAACPAPPMSVRRGAL